MKKYLKWINPLNIFKLPKKVWIPLLIILIASAGWLMLRPKSTVDQPQFAQVKKETIKATVSASGLLTGKDSLNLHFKSGGKLVYLAVKTGDKVYRGQTLASLDTQDLNISLQQAQNTFRDKQATAQKIEDDVKDHKTDETFTQAQTRTSAQAARDSAYDNVKAAQRDFQDAVISSPIDGIVTQSPILVGQFVSASDTVVQVVNWVGGVYFDADIDEADIAKISVAQTVEITLNAFENQTFTGKVAEILSQTETTSSGATIVSIRIKLDQPPTKLIANLNGQASIIVKQVDNALGIPQEAVINDDIASAKVVVQTATGLQTKTVKTGILSDTDIEITEGLTEGERVLTNPDGFVNVTSTRSSNPLNRIFGAFRPRRS